jgi:selenocysteine lyase/cysteine desulfurase
VVEGDENEHFVPTGSQDGCLLCWFNPADAQESVCGEPQAIGQYLNRRGIAVRAGHHCAQPILRRFGHEATVRPSLGLYNDDSDIERLVRALRELHPDRRASASR